VKPLAFFALLALLVALGCASVAREESRRVYQLGGEDEGMDSLQVEAKYFNGGGK
jgi:hypothetical protein